MKVERREFVRNATGGTTSDGLTPSRNGPSQDIAIKLEPGSENLVIKREPGATELAIKLEPTPGTAV